jgi:hypothetical protein
MAYVIFTTWLRYDRIIGEVWDCVILSAVIRYLWTIPWPFSPSGETTNPMRRPVKADNGGCRAKNLEPVSHQEEWSPVVRMRVRSIPVVRKIVRSDRRAIDDGTAIALRNGPDLHLAAQ